MSAGASLDPVVCADWRELPLAGGGRCLVEASAGTGKTWTIAVLYLRLLLECQHGPRQIVVATFTDAAAQELRERIRARVLEAASLSEAFEPAKPVRDDEGTRWLHARWSSMDASTRTIDRKRLLLALSELDLAPIGTLHSLCRRILSEHPFDSGSAFDPGEQVDSAELDDELRTDLWRRLAQSDPDALEDGDRAWFAAGRKMLDEALKKVCTPGVSVLAIDCDALSICMTATQAALIRDWTGRAVLQPRKRKLRERLMQLADFLEAGDPRAPLPAIATEKLDDLLAEQLQPDALAPATAHPAILLVRRLMILLNHPDASAQSTALARYRDDLLASREKRLHDRGQLTHDALIERTFGALAGPAGSHLAEALCKAWPVALVDEFQDTDARQYAILDRVYCDIDGGARGRLVMIGDPKQAIYGFRGGDVQAYLDASASATHVLRLATNFRSSLELVGACNELFELAGPALGQSPSARIAYAAVEASGRHDARPLMRAGSPVMRPLVFHVATVKVTNKDVHRAAALTACANTIAEMLQSREYRIGNELLQPGDIAVLLPTNRDIERLRVLLTDRKVPCVGAGKGSVFATDVARDLQVLLHGIEHAGDAALVRAALATRFFGLGIEGVRALQDSSEPWQRHAQQFLRWRQQWRNDGVLAVVQSVAAANAAPLSAAPNAERLLTDLRHLGESLQEQAESRDGPESLLAWFAEQRHEGEGDAQEERQLRIESDAGRVQLMTVHASKGLQFPVVFLPLLDADATRTPKMPLVRNNTGGRWLDLGSAGFDAAVKAAMFDEQDEAFRKLYVAITRAQVACHVFASTAKIDDTDPGRAAMLALLCRMRDGLQGRSVVDACAHIDWLENERWPSEFRANHPDAAKPQTVRSTPGLPAPRAPEGRYSFSALTRQRGMFEDSVASDEDADGVRESSVETDADEAFHPGIEALSMHRGERFGIALHSIFERRTLGQPLREQHELIERCLAEAAVRSDGATIEAVAARVQAALEAPLLPEREPPLRLSALDAKSMRAEMGFHYALDGVSMQRLRDACARHGEPDLVPPQTPHALRGLMTGAIDLVFEHDGRFHVLDYKSNHLGERLGAYAPKALGAEMDRHHYRFQALLYTIALDRYLRQRMPGYRREQHLGEAIYLFVRAAGLAPGAGVWSHRFDDGLIAAADAVLANDDAEATA